MRKVRLINDSTFVKVGTVLAGSYPTNIAYDTDRGEFFLPGGGSSASVDVINDTTNTVVSTIGVGSSPQAVGVDEALGHVYVVNTGSGNVSVISDSTNKVVASLGNISSSTTPVYDPGSALMAVASGSSLDLFQASTNTLVADLGLGSYPAGAAYDPAMHEVFIPNEFSGNVSVVSTVTGHVVAWIPVGRYPDAATYDAGTHEMFIDDDGSDCVSVISDVSDSVVAVVNVGTGPYGGVYDPRQGEVFIPNQASNNMSVINDTTLTTVATITTGNSPDSVAYDGALGLLFVVNSGSGGVSVINATTNTITSIISLGVGDLNSVTYDGETGDIFLSVSGQNEVLVYVASSAQFVASIRVGAGPLAGVYNSGKGEIFVTNSASNNVSVISDATNTVVATVPVGLDPAGGTFDPDDDTVVISNELSGSLSFLDAGFAVIRFSASPNPLSLGQTTNFSVTTAEGSAPFTYVYSGLPSSCASADSPTLACKPSAEGTYNVTVKVVDGAGASANSSLSLVVTPLTITSFQATPNPVDPEHATFLNVSVVGGLPPYTFSYLGLPAGCVNANTSALACTPRAEGTFKVTAHVTDAVGDSVRWNTTLTVIPVTVAFFNASSGDLNLGNLTFLNVTVRGGAGPFTYSYAGLPRGCHSANVSSLLCRPTGEGSFTIKVNVTDALGNRTSSSLSVQINQELATVTLAPTPSVSLFPNGNQNFFATALNSSGDPLLSGVVYQWVIEPAFLGTLNVTSGSTVALRAGSTLGEGTLWVNATLGGYFKSTSDQIFVSNSAGPSIFNFGASPSSIPLGGSTTISTSASGTGNLTYAYSGLPPGCVSSDVSAFSCLPTAEGSYSLKVAVSDPLGRTVDSTNTLVVTAPTNVLAKLVVSPTGPLQMPLGTSEGFTATPENVNGGTFGGPVIDWAFSPSYLGMLNTTVGSIVLFTAGQHTVEGNLYINTSWAGVTKTAVVVISVAPAGAGPSEGLTILGLSEFDFVSLIVAVAAVVVPVTLELRKRERKEKAERVSEEKAKEEKAVRSSTEGSQGTEAGSGTPAPSPPDVSPSGASPPPPPPSSTVSPPLPPTLPPADQPTPLDRNRPAG